jgi:response regulator of citrate/malate metabolism
MLAARVWIISRSADGNQGGSQVRNAQTDLIARRPRRRFSPQLLLLTDDPMLVRMVGGVVKRPWKLTQVQVGAYARDQSFTQPEVRLIVFDDQAVADHDREPLLAGLRRQFASVALLYVAARHDEATEKCARTNGAHYYVSRPLAESRFELVLESFLTAQSAKA